MILPMVISEQLLWHELDNPLFGNETEIRKVIASLARKGILGDKETEYSFRIGDIQKGRKKKIVAFVRKDLDQELKHARLRLYREIFEPK
jgi:hypothetical protein